MTPAGWEHVFRAFGVVLATALVLATAVCRLAWLAAAAVVAFVPPHVRVCYVAVAFGLGLLAGCQDARLRGLRLAGFASAVALAAVAVPVLVGLLALAVPLLGLAVLTALAVLALCVAFYLAWLPHCACGLLAFWTLDRGWLPYGGSFFAQHTLIFWCPFVVQWASARRTVCAARAARERTMRGYTTRPSPEPPVEVPAAQPRRRQELEPVPGDRLAPSSAPPRPTPEPRPEPRASTTAGSPGVKDSDHYVHAVWAGKEPPRVGQQAWFPLGKTTPEERLSFPVLGERRERNPVAPFRHVVLQRLDVKVPAGEGVGTVILSTMNGRHAAERAREMEQAGQGLSL